MTLRVPDRRRGLRVQGLGVLCLLLGAGCTVSGPRKSGGDGDHSALKPMTRAELLQQLATVATTLESSPAGLAGREALLTACITLGQLDDQAAFNPGGPLLLADDGIRIGFAKNMCAEDPGIAAKTVGMVLYDTHPREGVEEPMCKGNEVEVRFARSGLDESGFVYLRVELISRTTRLCVVDGTLNARLLTADGRNIAAAPWGGSNTRYRTLPGRGTVQWIRVSYRAAAELCTGHLVPVKELQVHLPTGDGPRTIPASALPAIARSYCPEAPPQLAEDAVLGLTGP